MQTNALKNLTVYKLNKPHEYDHFIIRKKYVKLISGISMYPFLENIWAQVLVPYFLKALVAFEIRDILSFHGHL